MMTPKLQAPYSPTELQPEPAAVPLPSAVPSFVSAALVLNGFLIAISVMGMAAGVIGLCLGEFAVFRFCSLFGIAFAFLIWHSRNLTRARKLAWMTQLGLSVAGLFLFPFGTIINIFLLCYWTRPEIKAWFRQSERNFSKSVKPRVQ